MDHCQKDEECATALDVMNRIPCCLPIAFHETEGQLYSRDYCRHGAIGHFLPAGASGVLFSLGLRWESFALSSHRAGNGRGRGHGRHD